MTTLIPFGDWITDEPDSRDVEQEPEEWTELRYSAGAVDVRQYRDQHGIYRAVVRVGGKVVCDGEITGEDFDTGAITEISDDATLTRVTLVMP